MYNNSYWYEYVTEKTSKAWVVNTVWTSDIVRADAMCDESDYNI